MTSRVPYRSGVGGHRLGQELRPAATLGPNALVVERSTQVGLGHSPLLRLCENASVGLYLNRRLRSQVIHDFDAVNVVLKS